MDLNPIRAGVATTLEASEWTSIQERLLAAARGEARATTGLVPFADEAVPDRAALPLPFGDYVEVLRWTAAALTERRDDGVPAEIAATLGRLGLAHPGFVESVRTYARSFFTMVGHVHRIDVESRRRGYRRRPGIRAARCLYGDRAA